MKTEILIVDNSYAKDLSLLQRSIPKGVVWSEDEFKELLSNEYNFCYVMKSQNSLLGFILYTHIREQAEILWLGVCKKYRRMGLASDLVSVVINHLKEQDDCLELFLEVAITNKEALNLYEKFSFKQIGVRKAYYNLNGRLSDALVLSLQM